MAKPDPKEKASIQDIKKQGGILTIAQSELFHFNNMLDMKHNPWLKRIKKNLGNSKVRLYEVINNGLEWRSQQVQLIKGDKVQVVLN